MKNFERVTKLPDQLGILICLLNPLVDLECAEERSFFHLFSTIQEPSCEGAVLLFVSKYLGWYCWKTSKTGEEEKVSICNSTNSF